MVRHPLHAGGGHWLQLDQVLGLQGDPWLSDHCLGGEAVLPAAMAVEWMAQVAACCLPTLQVVEARNLRVLNGVRLVDHHDRRLMVRSQPAGVPNAGETLLDVEIVDTAALHRVCYRATIGLAHRLHPAPCLPALLPPVAPRRTGAEQAYRDYLFHGPRFRVLEGELLSNQHGIDATVRRSTPTSFGLGGGHWHFDPALLDAMPQLAIVWSRLQFDTTPLPSAMARIRRFAADGDGPLRLFWRTRSDAAAHWTHFDAWVADPYGRVVLQVEGAEGAASAALNRLAA
nr:polyketide synthase dehydratase domain-containing protein [Polycyclovorans algicola]